ncbi:MAG: helix-turn-helix transcriptional regulator [bacterium]
MIGDKIKYWRKKRGLTQEELAKKAGLYYTMVCKIEQNFSKDPTIHTVNKIADALNISLDDLVERKRRLK